MRRLQTCLFLLATTVLITSRGMAASFTALGSINECCPASQPTDLSPDGSTVVGESLGGYVWDRANGMRQLVLPDGRVESHMYGVSSNGSVVVGEMRDYDHGWPFIWDAVNGMRELSGPLGGFQAPGSAHAVSSDGRVVAGAARNASGNVEAFVWDEINGRRGLGDLPGGLFNSVPFAMSADGSVVVGQGHPQSGNSEAFIWDATNGMRGLGDLYPDFPESWATDVSADGSTVVGGGHLPGSGLAFIWDEAGGMRRLGDLPGGVVSSLAQGVSGDGSIVVGFGYTASGPEAVLWDAEHGVITIEVLLTSLGIDLAGWSLEQAMAISDDGLTIAGYGISPAGRDSGWIAVIPEPNTALLLSLGLAGLTYRRR